VLDHLDEAPIWPELPRCSFLEELTPSPTDGLPCLVVDEEARRIYIDTRGDCAAELAAFYEKALSAEKNGELAGFARTPRYASALEATARALQAKGARFPGVTVQCRGPVSLQLQLTDAEGKSLFYNETFQDVLTRQVCLQSRWIARRFMPFTETLLAFLDEPSLAAFGSSGYVGVSREDVVLRLGAAVDALRTEGAVVGVHVCGNTDWSMVLETDPDLLSYDAYEFGPSMLIYADEVAAHLASGGVLAWGIVPTSARVREETAASLEERFFSLVNDLSSREVDKELILNQSMITPSCGMGAMSVEDAVRAATLLAELARSLRAKVR